MRFFSIIGTGPSLIKELLINNEFKKRDTQEAIMQASKTYD